MKVTTTNTVESGPKAIRQQLAQALIERGASLHIAKEVRYSLTTVYNYKENIWLFGHTWAPSISRIGPPPVFTVEMLDVCPFILLFF